MEPRLVWKTMKPKFVWFVQMDTCHFNADVNDSYPPPLPPEPLIPRLGHTTCVSAMWETFSINVPFPVLKKWSNIVLGNLFVYSLAPTHKIYTEVFVMVIFVCIYWDKNVIPIKVLYQWLKADLCMHWHQWQMFFPNLYHLGLWKAVEMLQEEQQVSKNKVIGGTQGVVL